MANLPEFILMISKIEKEESLVFDDVLLKPKYSEVRSRADVDVSIELTKGLKLAHPIVPSNMKNVVGYEMAKLISSKGGLTILHRFMPIDDQLALVKRLFTEDPNNVNYIGVSIGIKSEDKDNLKKFVDLGVKVVCIDVAHGHSIQCIEMIKFVVDNYPDVFLIAGNTATYEGTLDLFLAGADVVKIGIGNGSICTTRIETGNGIPLLSSLIEGAKAKESFLNAYPNKKVFIMSDGGCRAAGDVVKSLCFADLCMIGNMFAGTDEAPGLILEIDGKRYKEYAGSSTHRGSRTEGVEALVPSKGSAESVLNRIIEGIQSGASYQGAINLKELKEKASFVKITSAGLKESHAHDVVIK